MHRSRRFVPRLIKRLFELFWVAFCAILLVLPATGVGLLIWVVQGRPIFFGSRRVGLNGRVFTMWKFRTMTSVSHDSGVSGADKRERITPLGVWLRATRVDEFPQLWNILCGHLSFVGPRAPLPEYYAAYPDLYRQVLQVKPGITGLATLRYHAREEAVLAVCETPEETDAAYRRVCIPRKANLDLIYAEHWSLCFDLALMWETLVKLLSRRLGDPS